MNSTVNQKIIKLSRYLAPALVVALLATGCSWKVKTLSVETPTVARSTLIYDKNGDIITHFRGEQHRILIQSLDEVPTIISNAVIAIEDERFWLHNGIDLRAIARAARSNISQGGISEGGSTITQQYVGLTYLDRTKQTTSRKIEEIALALQFERLYSKEFILREYLNTVYFGEGAYGIKAAAQEFFDKELSEVTLAEAALLAGLIQAPTTFNPYFNVDQSLRRRAEVLESMLDQEIISQKDYDIARTEPLTLKPRVAILDETYIAPYFVEEVRQWILSNPLFGETRAERATLLFEEGLHIYTTLDPEAQQAAEAAVTNVLPEEVDDLSSAVVVIENDTGFVRALIGGQNFFGDNPEARFNIATQGGRQAGSAMKPFALAAALEQGATTSDYYYAPPKIDLPIPGSNTTWRVQGGIDNTERVTLYQGLVDSINTVYAQLSQKVGPQSIVDMAERLGIESTLAPVLSIVLGSEDVTTLDMAAAYSTFARRGIKVEPSFVTRIAAANGTLLYEHELGGERVLDRNISDQVTGAMVDVILNGTGVNAYVNNIQLAGKTGTSTNYYDATFTGFSAQYTVSVWVGFPSGQIAMEPPLLPIRVSGGTYPAAIFQKTMSALPQENSRPLSNAVRLLEPEPDPVFRLPVFRLPFFETTTRATAVNELNNLKLLISVEEVLAQSESDLRLGTVIDQSPQGFRFVREGDVVTITVVTIPTDCRDFLDLVAESFIKPDLIIGPSGRVEDTLLLNIPVIEVNFSIPSDCDALIADRLEQEEAAELPNLISGGTTSPPA